MKRVFFLVLAATLVMIVGCKKDNDDKGVVMTMATSISGEMTFYMVGSESGIITIDWGDGSAIETHTLGEYGDDWHSPQYTYSHDYSGTFTRTVTITGENITRLECSNNQLTSLDVSKNTLLLELYCEYNQLTSLDISKNVALEELSCWNNQLTNLDVSKNALLSNLQCGENQLTSLNVSTNTALIGLQCANNQLTNLDVSNNTKLYHLFCQSNHLTSLDMSKNTEIFSLQCSNNKLDSTALNALFETLNDNNNWDKYLYIWSNPGENICSRNIAEDKGWEFMVWGE